MQVYKTRKLESILAKFQDAKEAIVVTGFRRVGKTVLMEHIYDSISFDNKLFLDLESPVNQRIFQSENYDNIPRALTRQGLDFKRKVYLFLDEMQKIKELPSIVKYLYDHYDIKFYLTGSSSFYLKNYFSESMAGRKFVFELFPLDFEEFLLFKEQRVSTKASNDQLSGLYKEYLQYGGFPTVVLTDSPDKKLIALDDILGSYFELDVKSLADFRNNQHLKDLLFLLTSRVGSKVEVTKLAESIGVSRPTVYAYLQFFEQTYLIHLLKPLFNSRDVQIKSIPKLYFNDTGLLNRIAQVSQGQLFENKIFNQLYTKLKYQQSHKYAQTQIAYYQRKTGAEIDFVIDQKIGYEIKSLATKRDFVKLEKAARDLKLTKYNGTSFFKEGGG